MKDKKNILIVDDDKFITKSLKQRIEDNLNFTVDICQSFEESKNMILNKKYFLTLLDLNLPDAKDDEIVNYFISKKIPSIVLTGNFDNELRNKLVKKNIIDYILKKNYNFFDYIIYLINRLDKNSKINILIIDDSKSYALLLKNILKLLFFRVDTALNEKDAFDLISKKDYKIILLDYYLENLCGIEILNKLRRQFKKDELIVIGLSSFNEQPLSIEFLKNGANDFLNKRFQKEELLLRIHNNLDIIENIENIKELSNKDYLTGIYNRRYFYKVITEYYKNTKDNFSLAMIDIDNFKKINDTYGHSVGDKMLILITKIILSHIKGNDIIARFGGEEFCLVLKNINLENSFKIMEKIRLDIQNNFISFNNKRISCTISIGLTTNKDTSLENMIIRADKLLYKAKETGKNKIIKE